MDQNSKSTQKYSGTSRDRKPRPQREGFSRGHNSNVSSDFKKAQKPGFKYSAVKKPRNSREEASFEREEQHELRVRGKGFSSFQLRLVNSILNDTIVNHKALDKSYAYWFGKVKIPSVEQGFLIKQINSMFRRLSFYAFAAGLKRPSDFERHVSRLTFVYCADKDWPLPELDVNEGIDRRSVIKRIGEARNSELLNQGCPVWLNELCQKELGEERWAQERKALSEEPRRYIRTNTLKCTRDELASKLKEEGVVTRSVKDAPLALEVTSNAALFRTSAFKNGLFEQQDAGSQAIAEFVGVKPGMRVIDSCAGAGGKTLQLATYMQSKGTIIALDTEQWKLDELKKRARRAGVSNIEPRHIESSKVIKRLYDHADAVLIDAPCSGTGVIRRMPDSKWRDGRERLNEIRNIQKDILSRYPLMAKVGGTVVYSTCSILPSENHEQIAAFLETCDGAFELVEEKTLYPSDGFDGFYMARLKRVK